MKKTILWLHHFQPYWEESLNKFSTSFEQEMEKVLDFVKHEEINEIKVTMFEDHEESYEHYPLIELCRSKGINIDFEEYGYGWMRDDEHSKEFYKKEDYGKTWIYGRRDFHTDKNIIEVIDWHHKIKAENSKVLLAGAFEDECLNDAEAVLDELEIDYEKLDELSVGANVEYEFRGKSPSEISQEIQDQVNQIDQEIEDKTIDLDIEDDIDELLKEDPHFVLEKFNELSVILEEYEEEFEEYDLDIDSNYSELYEIIETYNNEQYIKDELEIIAQEKIKEAIFKKVYAPGSNIKEYYHGTTWRIEDGELKIHTDLDRDFSGYGANYVSNEEAVAEWFKSWGMNDEEDGIRVVFKLKMELNKVLEWEMGMDREILIDGNEYDIIEDRETMYTDLDGDYDAINIKNNYPEQDGGDDIALLLDVPEGSIEGIKIMKSQDEWTEYLSVDEAKEFAKKMLKVKKSKKTLKI